MRKKFHETRTVEPLCFIRKAAWPNRTRNSDTPIGQEVRRHRRQAARKPPKQTVQLTHNSSQPPKGLPWWWSVRNRKQLGRCRLADWGNVEKEASILNT
ncbi:Hypothetical protein NTJ_00999 [Nesidiocoris tenuis]|uniref:Uncharacterized protein n=1 Tax=Nesidiocoris tenuis TaxID=355587 RepID=A0ABN7A8A0_9HEMI|nr:Hypothetical protein NTJ_00999 [Nesidiocoris tenuis]